MTLATSDASDVVFAGAVVRLLVNGRSSHTLEGEVVQSTEDSLQVRITGSSNTPTIPASAIVSIEMQRSTDGKRGWQPARLPPSMATLVEPIARLFLTGAGAPVRRVTLPYLKEAQGCIGRAAEQMFVPSNVALCDELRGRLELLSKCMQSERDFETAAWA